MDKCFVCGSKEESMRIDGDMPICSMCDKRIEDTLVFKPGDKCFVCGSTQRVRVRDSQVVLNYELDEVFGAPVCDSCHEETNRIYREALDSKPAIYWLAVVDYNVSFDDWARAVGMYAYILMGRMAPTIAIFNRGDIHNYPISQNTWGTQPTKRVDPERDRELTAECEERLYRSAEWLGLIMDALVGGAAKGRWRSEAE